MCFGLRNEKKNKASSAQSWAAFTQILMNGFDNGNFGSMPSIGKKRKRKTYQLNVMPLLSDLYQ